MTRLGFVKMEGAGNDYIYVDAMNRPFPVDRGPELARAWSDRHFGIGGDGLIVVAPSQTADCRMLMWNADGSRSGMCGNGVRCIAKLVWDLGVVRRPELRIETDSCVVAATLRFSGDEVVGAAVQMGPVTLQQQPSRARIADRDLTFHPGDAGNPHAVVFVDEDPEQVPVELLGAAFQELPAFPTGVNVEFVQVLDDGSLRQRTYERGSGETLACGSGATVAAVAALDTGRVPGPRVPVHLRGGTLTIERHGSALVMEGPARTVFAGEVVVPGHD